MDGEDWFRGNRWPPQDFPELKTWSLAATPPAFRPADWSFEHFAVAALSEFVTQGGGAWTGISIPPPPTAPADSAFIAAEIEELREIAEFRAGAMAEALEQRDNVIGYFRGLLTYKGATHPWTSRLCTAALRIGQLVVLHHKKVHMRGRPSVHAPALMPPADPPGHPAYPSGHATQAYLIAMVLAEVLPGIAWGDGQGGAKMPVTPADLAHPTVANTIMVKVSTVPGVAERMRLTPVWRIAERVARNRELIGVHFPTDSEAGLRLAVQTLPLLLACPLVGTPGTGALDLARAEWV